MSDLRIDVATADDWERVRAVRLAALDDAPDAFWATLDEERERPESAWRAWIDRDRSATLLAVLDDDAGSRDVGLAVVGPHHELAGVGGLYSVWIDPVVRGRGAGDALLRHAVDHARELGYPRVLLDVGDHNRAAIALYERAGFAPTGRTSSLPPPRDHITEHERALDVAPR